MRKRHIPEIGLRSVRPSSAARRSGAIRILIGHHDPLVRLGICAVLTAEQRCLVVGDVGEGSRVVWLAGCLQPHVLLVDADLLGDRGLEMLQCIEQRAPQTRVVILGHGGNTTDAAGLLRHGAAAFLPQRASGTQVVEAVRQAAAGHLGMTPWSDAYDHLTPRERDVLHLSVAGYTVRAIAEQLAVSWRTVAKHRENVTAKLGLHGQTERIHYGVRHGIYSLSSQPPPSQPTNALTARTSSVGCNEDASRSAA